MDNVDSVSPMIARCIVCKGNIHEQDVFETWEGAFYCERHSLPHLRARAREYAMLLGVEKSIADQR
jgi:hypothetical protein